MPMAIDRYSYPFTAIVGQDEMKLALVLNAINPSIGGVLIRGEKGTGKSTAVRALARLLPEHNVVEGCHFGCDPEDTDALCSECRQRLADAGKGDGFDEKVAQTIRQQAEKKGINYAR